jgi:hypothetical protein
MIMSGRIYIVEQKRVLCGGPISQSPEILKAYLDSLAALLHEGMTLDFAFMDDNKNPEASKLLHEWKRGKAQFLPPLQHETAYVRDERTHYWNQPLMLWMSAVRNLFLEYALENDYDYFFFVDSDMVLHPDTLPWLVLSDKSIIGEILWSTWTPDGEEQPNVWMQNQYDLFNQGHDEIAMSETEKQKRRYVLMQKWRTPGVFEVGGVGGSKLIRRDAMERGVNYSPISNLTSILGEDRFFGIRAAVLGIPQYVDTHVPSLHLYRSNDMAKLNDFWEKSAAANRAAQYVCDNQ